MENFSKVSLKQNKTKKKKKNQMTDFHNSIQDSSFNASFYYHLPVVEKCLEKWLTST